MPARRLINLLPQDEFAASSAGKFLFFFLNFGRYVVIFTELIVILAFLFRIVLDRQKSDLNDKIQEQVQFLAANSQVEQQFRFTQARLNTAGNLLTKQFGATNLINRLTALISSDITVTKLSIDHRTVQVAGLSRSMAGLGQTVANFRASDWLTNVSLGSVSTTGSTGGQVQFTLNAEIKQIPTKGASS